MPDCCVSAERASTRQACPRCGAVGSEVGRETVGAMVTLNVPASVLRRPAFRFCDTADCPVVYYAGDVAVERAMVRVPVHAKDAGLDVPLCYCFGHTRRSILAETRRTGRSTTSARIAADIRAGRCACDLKNPSGRCCLGDVRAYQKHAAKAAADHPEVEERQ